jgi:RNA polymerase sigma factor (sigma-70 family)
VTDPTPPEKPLWVRACGGDARAFGAIFDRHRDRVYRHAFWMLGDVHDAQDATSVAFFELWRGRGRVRLVDDSVLPWLLVTASNVTRNLRRGQRRYGGVLRSLRPADAQPSAEEEAAERGSVYDHVDPRLAEGLRALSATDCGLMLLTILEGYSVAEAAAALGLTEGAAKTRLSRARARLRDELPLPARPIIEGGTS